MTEQWIKDLKPGDPVIVCSGGLRGQKIVARVTALTPSGRIKVHAPGSKAGYVFAPSGLEFSGRGLRARIEPCGPGDAERLADEHEHERLAARFGGMTWRDWQGFSLETLRAIRDLLAAVKVGS